MLFFLKNDKRFLKVDTSLKSCLFSKSLGTFAALKFYLVVLKAKWLMYLTPGVANKIPLNYIEDFDFSRVNRL